MSLGLRPGRSYLFSDAGEKLGQLISGFPIFDQVIVDATELDVKILRTVINQVQLAANNRRLLLIKNAESLSDVMQNTLLKLLEEPPSTLIIVLQTLQAQRLIPTVQSRLHQLAANFIAPSIPATIFKGLPKQIFETLSKLTRELLVVALAGELIFQRQELLSSPSAKQSARIELLDRAVKKIQANANQKLTLDWLLLHWESN